MIKKNKTCYYADSADFFAMFPPQRNCLTSSTLIYLSQILKLT